MNDGHEGDDVHCGLKYACLSFSFTMGNEKMSPKPAWWARGAREPIPEWAPRAWRVPGPSQWRPTLAAASEWDLPDAHWRTRWWRGAEPPGPAWIRFLWDDESGELNSLVFVWGGPQRGSIDQGVNG